MIRKTSSSDETFDRAFVTFCDINEEKGKALEAEIGANVAFVRCDTRSWEDQIRLFDTACTRSPGKSVDIVVANAGVGRGPGDPLMQLEGEQAVGRALDSTEMRAAIAESS